MCLILSGAHNCNKLSSYPGKDKWDVDLQFRLKNCTNEIPKLGKGPLDPKFGQRVQITPNINTGVQVSM